MFGWSSGSWHDVVPVCICLSARADISNGASPRSNRSAPRDCTDRLSSQSCVSACASLRAVLSNQAHLVRVRQVPHVAYHSAASNLSAVATCARGHLDSHSNCALVPNGTAARAQSSS
eukprot:3274300-Pyramimonas_sp.AAC.1